jgi:hypothetical protein
MESMGWIWCMFDYLPLEQNQERNFFISSKIYNTYGENKRL